MRKAMFLSILLVTVGAAASAIAAPPGGHATGGFSNTTVEGQSAHRSFNAQGTPTDAKGQIETRVTDSNGNLVRQWHGVVDCYKQVGNRAWFSGQVTNTQGGVDVEGQFFIFAVEDNGEGKKSPPDRSLGHRSVLPFDCGTATFEPTQPVEKGNIQVH